jgi:hypothetical protein
VGAAPAVVTVAVTLGPGARELEADRHASRHDCHKLLLCWGFLPAVAEYQCRRPSPM